MSNKSIIAAIEILLIVILTVSSILVMEVKANPVPWRTTPDQDKPTLTIESPQNNTAINDGSVCLNFKVTTPDSWNDPQWFMPYIGQISSVRADFDGNRVFLESNSEGYSVKLNLNQSASGIHTLNVTVLSYTYYSGPVYNGSLLYSQSSRGPVYQYPLVVSDIVYFTVAGETSPSPLPQTESSPNATFAAVSALVAISIAVCAGLIFYYAKRKRRLTAV